MAGEGGGEGACRNEQGAGGTRFIALLSDLVAQNSSPPLLVFSSSPLFTSSAFKPSICLGAGGRCTSLFTASADLVNSNLLPSISSPYIAAMSFDRLPIEIVHDVAGFLPSTDCTTVSRVSKTCRAAAEPHLYRDPVFFVNCEIRVRWLLATLLHRPKLAAYIKSIKFLGRTPSYMVATATASPRPSCDACQYIEDARAALDTAMLDICGSQPDLAWRPSCWKRAVLADNYLEGSLALIVCMAVNIKVFAFRPWHLRREEGYFVPELDTSMGTFMSIVLRDVARISYAPGSQQIRRLRGLEFLHIDSPICWHLCMLPSLKTVLVNCPIEIHSVGTNINNLRNLFIADFTSSLFYLGKPLGDSIPPNLVKLSYRTKFDPILADTYQQFIDMLITDCPQLEELEFGFTTLSTLSRDVHCIVNPLRNMNRLSRLQRLRIDMDLLAYHANIWDELLTDTYLLPPRLRSLELTNICHWCLGGFINNLLCPNDIEVLRHNAPILSVKEQSWAMYVESLPEVVDEHLDEIEERFEITIYFVACIIDKWSSTDLYDPPDPYNFFD